MTRVWGLNDWFVVIHMNGALTAATVYMFLYHSATVFGTWCTLVATMSGFYHFMTVSDDKRPDAGG